MSSVDAELGVHTEIVVEEPRKYKVILHNDNKTTFDFVIKVLQAVFLKPFPQAVELTQHVHITGAAIVGIYTKEIAEEKVLESTTLARSNGYPLVTSCEEV
jgi:ATP-dependent Clp protease adaptor protein ClpS